MLRQTAAGSRSERYAAFQWALGRDGGGKGWVVSKKGKAEGIFRTTKEAAKE
jgi:hypothetical protein